MLRLYLFNIFTKCSFKNIVMTSPKYHENILCQLGSFVLVNYFLFCPESLCHLYASFFISLISFNSDLNSFPNSKSSLLARMSCLSLKYRFSLNTILSNFFECRGPPLIVYCDICLTQTTRSISWRMSIYQYAHQQWHRRSPKTIFDLSKS